MFSSSISYDKEESMVIYLKNNIAEKVEEKVKECLEKQRFSTITFKDVKEIISTEIDKYVKINDSIAIDCYVTFRLTINLLRRIKKPGEKPPVSFAYRL